MIRTAKSQSEHDQIVQTVVNHLVHNGYRNICADLPGHTQPALVNGTKQDHIPDVTADGVIVEVETGDTIEGDHTTSQWSLFSDHAAKSGKTFWVVVPNGSVAAAQSRLNTLRLTGVVYGV
jgi:hypothetical protein